MLFHPTENATVTNLASEFNLTKATISGSIKVLEQKKLITRNYRDADNRSFTLSLSKNGKKIAQSSGIFANIVTQQVQSLDNTQQSSLLNSLLEIIHKLNRSGILTSLRMCKTCRFFESGKTGYSCLLINQTFQVSELRLDCPEHETKSQPNY